MKLWQWDEWTSKKWLCCCWIFSSAPWRHDVESSLRSEQHAKYPEIYLNSASEKPFRIRKVKQIESCKGRLDSLHLFGFPKSLHHLLSTRKPHNAKYLALVIASKKPYKVTVTFVHKQTTCKLSWKSLSKVPLKCKLKQIEPWTGGHYLLPGNYWVPSPTSASSSAPVNNIVSCGCRSVVSGGIVGLIQCCLLWTESGGVWLPYSSLAQ